MAGWEIMNLLYAYSRNRPEDQKETKAFIEHLRKNSTGINIYESKGEFNADYEQSFDRMLELGEDFMILEQDIVPTYLEFMKLAVCPEVVCSAKYYLYPKSTLLQKPEIASRTQYIDGRGFKAYKWSREEDEYADFMGFGLCKFSAAIIPYIKDYKRTGEWINLDSRVSDELFKHNIKIHLHGLVRHNHQ